MVFIWILLALVGLALLAIAAVTLLTPWMDRWGLPKPRSRPACPAMNSSRSRAVSSTAPLRSRPHPGRFTPGCCSSELAKAAFTAIRRWKG